MPFYGWAVVAMGALITFCSGPGQSYVFSVFIDPIINATGITRTTISALYAVGTGVSALMVVVVSRLVDRFGARIMVPLIAFALGAASFGMSMVTGVLTVMFGFAALRALGQGSMQITATLMAAQWFVRYRGRAMALVGLGFAASNAMFPPFTRYLVDSIGWREAYMVLGVMVWVLIIPLSILIIRNRPEDIGLYPDGAPEPPKGEKQPASDGPDESRLARRPRRVLTTATFWMLAIPLSAPSFVTTALVFHQVSIFDERGLGADIAASVFIPFAIASAVASTGAGFLVDRLGPKLLVISMLGIMLGSVIGVAFIRSPLEAALYAILLGAGSGMMSIATGVTWAHYYGRIGLGRVQGPAMMVALIGSALGPLPVAALQGMTGDYSLSILAMAILVVTCIIIAAVNRPPAAFAQGN